MIWDWLGAVFRPGPTFRFRILLIVIAVYLFVDATRRCIDSWIANYLVWRLEYLFGGLLIFAAWWLLQSESAD
ncbi:MAG TPA: hypothetical protein VGS20_06800 [Candidatus Acidoferrales bacterium]|nr:hypothetical protein [Candidatus Acidoferrales bacterium]